MIPEIFPGPAEGVETVSKFSGDIYTITVQDESHFVVALNGVPLGIENSRQEAIDRVNDHFL